MPFKCRQLRAMLAVALAVLPLTAAAQAYPSRPIRLVVPFTPGFWDFRIT